MDFINLSDVFSNPDFHEEEYVVPLELNVSRKYLTPKKVNSIKIPLEVRGQEIPNDIFKFILEVYPHMREYLKYYEIVVEYDEFINNFIIYMVGEDSPKYKEYNPVGKYRNQEYYQFWFAKFRYFRKYYWKNLLKITKFERETLRATGKMLIKDDKYKFEEIPIYKYQPDHLYIVTEFKDFLKTYYPKEYVLFQYRMRNSEISYEGVSKSLHISKSTIKRRVHTLKKLVSEFFSPNFSGDLLELI